MGNDHRERGEQNARGSRQSGPYGKCDREDSLGIDPEGVGHLRVLDHCPHVEAKARLADEQIGCRHDCDCNCNHDQSVGRIVDSKNLNGGGDRRVHALRRRTKDQLQRLLHDQGQPPGGHDGCKRALVEELDDRSLDEKSDQGANERCQEKSQPKTASETLDERQAECA